jgi:multicomponent Na+:H+ antiporter subunit C
VIDFFLGRYVYLFVLVLLCIGLYGILAKGDLVKKIIGMTIFQTSIYLFFIQGSLQEGGTAPIIDPEIGPDPAAYVDPLPHLLILTAIVVGVGVLGVALSLVVRIHRAHGSLDEEEVAARLAGAPIIGSPGDSSRGDGPPGDSSRGDGGHLDDDGGGSPTSDPRSDA